MKWIHWMVVVAAASMFILGGCKSKASTPKELLENMHKASEKTDMSAMVDCMEPDAQKVMKEMAPAMEDMLKSTKELGNAVEKKFGAEEAKSVTQSGQGKGFSPIHEAVTDGKVDWSKVNIKEEGDKATFEINGHKNGMEMKKVDGVWYAALPEGQRPKPEELQKQIEMFKKMAANMRELAKKVDDGQVKKEDFGKEFLGAMMSAMKDAPRN